MIEFILVMIIVSLVYVWFPEQKNYIDYILVVILAYYITSYLGWFPV